MNKESSWACPEERQIEDSTITISNNKIEKAGINSFKGYGPSSLEAYAGIQVAADASIKIKDNIMGNVYGNGITAISIRNNVEIIGNQMGNIFFFNGINLGVASSGEVDAFIESNQIGNVDGSGIYILTGSDDTIINARLNDNIFDSRINEGDLINIYGPGTVNPEGSQAKYLTTIGL